METRSLTSLKKRLEDDACLRRLLPLDENDNLHLQQNKKLITFLFDCMDLVSDMDLQYVDPKFHWIADLFKSLSYEQRSMYCHHYCEAVKDAIYVCTYDLTLLPSIEYAYNHMIPCLDLIGLSAFDKNMLTQHQLSFDNEQRWTRHTNSPYHQELKDY